MGSVDSNYYYVAYDKCALWLPLFWRNMLPWRMVHWRWRQYVPLKCWQPPATRLHTAMIQKLKI